MKRQEWWRVQYQTDPYLRGIDDQAVKARTDDVTANSWFITNALKLGMISAPDPFWMISWTHLLEEWGSRGGIPGGQDPEKLPNPDWPGLGSAVTPLEFSRRTHQNVLIKYGDRRHLRQSMEAGSFLIRPASTYDDPSLNRAVRDNELELSVYRRSRLYTLLYDQHSNALAPTGPAYGYRIEALKSPTNYYAYCLGMRRSLRMFGDFKANAAMIIHDPRRFLRRLGEGVRQILGAGWSWYATPIHYIDPLRAPAGPLDIIKCKNFSFAYQCEYRIVWVPDRPLHKLEPLSISVPPVADCASLVELSEA